MRTVETIVYTFDELSESAKEKAREWYRDGGFDYEWYDGVYETMTTAGACLGVDIDRIYFSGFSSQGDGACYEGAYAYKRGWRQALRAEFGGDFLAAIERIGQELQDIQRPFLYRLEATVTHRGHYQHSGCTDIQVTDARTGDYANEDVASAIQDALRGFMDLIYRQLEAEYEYLTSEETVSETLRANDYQFTKDGSIY